MQVAGSVAEEDGQAQPFAQAGAQGFKLAGIGFIAIHISQQRQIIAGPALRQEGAQCLRKPQGRNGMPHLPLGVQLDPILSESRHTISTLRLSEALRSEEHTSELQSLAYLVCRLLLEKKKK